MKTTLSAASGAQEAWRETVAEELLIVALKQIVARTAEWNANQLGGVGLQRQRWQKLGRIASEALWKHDLETRERG